MEKNDQKENKENKGYDDYLKNLREKLDDIKVENERTLGRNTLIIAGGAFTLSVTLIKEIYPCPLPWSKWVLIASWAIFGLCAFLQIYSDHLSSQAVDVHRRKLDDYYLQHQEEALQRPNRYDQWVQRINGLTHWFLFFGFACMIFFSAANFVHTNKGGKDMGCKKKTTTNGANKAVSETTNKVIKEKNPLSGDKIKGVTMPPIPRKPAKSSSKSRPK